MGSCTLTFLLETPTQAFQVRFILFYTIQVQFVFELPKDVFLFSCSTCTPTGRPAARGSIPRTCGRRTRVGRTTLLHRPSTVCSPQYTGRCWSSLGRSRRRRWGRSFVQHDSSGLRSMR